MKSQNGINFLNEVIQIKRDAECLVRELNTFLTEDDGVSLKSHTWERIKNSIEKLSKAIK